MTPSPSILLSTRTLLLFKGLIIVSVLIVPFLMVLVAIEQSWPSLLLAFNWVVIAVYTLRGMRRLRSVMWEKDHLLIKDQVDIIIPLSEIKAVELKAINGIHEVRLLEEHPYVGDHFYFLTSMTYVLKHHRIDEQMHQLRKAIKQARTKAMHQ